MPPNPWGTRLHLLETRNAPIVIQTALDAPDFLYMPQLGAVAGSTTLSQTEIAAKMAFALWNAPPDAPLLAAAAAGQLTPAGIKTQAARMIADPLFGASAGYFLQQLLELQGVGSLSKDQTLFPNYTPALGQAIAQETSDFVSYVFLQGDARLDTLLTANFSVLTPPLFTFYGVPMPADWTAGQPTTLPASGDGARRGILTQAAFHAAHAHPNATNVVERGKILRANLMCSPLPAPPNNVPPLPARVPGAQTARQTFAVHEANASCAACHKLMDPLGLSFEHFDAIGAWRAKDGQLAIDTSGNFSTTNVASAAFTDGLDLSGALASNIDVQNCLVLQTFRFVSQRLESDADSCQIQQLQQHFAASNHDLRALILEMVTSNLFTTFPGGGS